MTDWRERRAEENLRAFLEYEAWRSREDKPKARRPAPKKTRR